MNCLNKSTISWLIQKMIYLIDSKIFYLVNIVFVLIPFAKVTETILGYLDWIEMA